MCHTRVCESVARGLKAISHARLIERYRDEWFVQIHRKGKERQVVKIERGKGKYEQRRLCMGEASEYDALVSLRRAQRPILIVIIGGYTLPPSVKLTPIQACDSKATASVLSPRSTNYLCMKVPWLSAKQESRHSSVTRNDTFSTAYLDGADVQICEGVGKREELRLAVIKGEAEVATAMVRREEGITAIRRVQEKSYDYLPSTMAKRGESGLGRQEKSNR